MATTREKVFRDKVHAYVDRHTNLKKVDIPRLSKMLVRNWVELSDSSELDLSPKEIIIVFVPLILDYMYVEEDNAHVEVQNINLENGELECVFVGGWWIYYWLSGLDERFIILWLITLFEVICNEIVKIEKDYL